MIMSFELQFLIFSLLILANYSIKSVRDESFSKTKSDWFIDLINLPIQGVLVPIIQFTLLFAAFDFILPTYRASVRLDLIWIFLINFVLVDYIYYWGHRFLHTKKMWKFHVVHHSAKVMDIFNTSRNSIISTFLIPYLWINSFFLYIIEDTPTYLFALGITAILDLWRHGQIDLPKQLSFLEHIFITPKLHSIHHSKKYPQKNFGANLVFWDKIHGTHLNTNEKVELGITVNSTLKNKLLFPWRIKQ
mgnify:CR=1 FL=1